MKKSGVIFLFFQGLNGGETMGYDNSRGGNRFSSGPRQMYDTVCSDCGKETQVPFQPTEGRPVYCKECYQKHKPARDNY